VASRLVLSYGYAAVMTLKSSHWKRPASALFQEGAITVLVVNAMLLDFLLSTRYYAL
jgi:hypothetical protein